MKSLKISNEVRCFFQYSFKGNGKYYTTEQGSRSYKNTSFQNVFNKNKDLIKVIESGNDAPKGGKNGNFVIVEFMPEFILKYQYVLDTLKEEKKQAELNSKRSELKKKLNNNFWNGDKSLFNQYLELYPNCKKNNAKDTIANIVCAAIF